MVLFELAGFVVAGVACCGAFWLAHRLDSWLSGE
jgi:hypothetical protein